MPVNIRKVIWAVDPFEEKGRPQETAADAVRCLMRRRGTVVQPVHVLSPVEMNLASEFTMPWEGHYQPAASRAVEQMLLDLQLPGVEKPIVLTQPVSSTARAADLISEYAREQGAELLLVSTHGRRGWSRLLLGSFTETLLLRSKVPVMVVGPHMRHIDRFRTGLIPTKFGDISKQVFMQTVEMAREWGSNLILYHSITRPIEPVYQSGSYMLGSPWVPVQEFYLQEKQRYERQASAWARWAAQQGVPVEVVLDADVRSVAENIARLARLRQVDWIAMESQRGTLAAALVGSVTRQVVRGSQCPVWVFRKSNVSQVAKPRDSKRAA